MDQPGKVANPARGQLNRENEHAPVLVRTCLRIWSRETGLAVPFRVSLLILHTQAESGRKTPFGRKERKADRPGSSEVPRSPLIRWDVSSIPANEIFFTKKLKTKIKMPNGWRTIKSLGHKIRLHGRRGKGMAESFSREKSRHAPQKQGG